jgi:hypothetical protein
MRQLMILLLMTLGFCTAAQAGNFYVNITLRGPTQDQVVAAMEKAHRIAYVSPAYDGSVVVYDKAADDQDIPVVTSLAGQLSKSLGCPAVAVLNHDDDEFMYWLFADGKKVDEYDSWPGYFNHVPRKPKGGDAKLLCATFRASGAEKSVDAVLRSTSYVVEIQRHESLFKLLKLPQAAIAIGYRYLSEGDQPSDFAKFKQTK